MIDILAHFSKTGPNDDDQPGEKVILENIRAQLKPHLITISNPFLTPSFLHALSYKTIFTLEKVGLLLIRPGAQ